MMKKGMLGIAALAVPLLFIGALAGLLQPAESAISETLPLLKEDFGYPYYYPSVTVLNGVAVDQDTVEDQPAVLIVMDTRRGEQAYLIIGEDLHQLEQIRSNYITGGYLVNYRLKDTREVLVLFKGDSGNYAGTLGNTLLVFQQNYYPYPVYAEPAYGDVRNYQGFETGTEPATSQVD